jgi:hypothetical protein
VVTTKTFRFASLSAALGVSLVGCSGSDISSDPTAATHDVRVTLQVASPAVAEAGGVSAAPTAKVTLDAVASLTFTVTALQLPQRCAESEDTVESECDGGGWLSLTLTNATPLDFMALPPEGESPVIIGAGTVPEGEYDRVRIFVADEEIVFLESFTVGQVTYEADVEYEVEIPSGDNTGIKTDLAVTVQADDEGNVQDVALLFDSEATFNGVVATGSGRIKLPPVLKTR